MVESAASWEIMRTSDYAVTPVPDEICESRTHGRWVLGGLLVYKAQVSSPPQSQKDLFNALMQSKLKTHRQVVVRDRWSNFASGSAMRPCEPNKSWHCHIPIPSTKSHLQSNKNLQLGGR